VLAPFALAYGAATTLRNWWFDHHPGHRLRVPVLSVGNLSAGGTGKTPLVAHLVERALQAGRRPGVLARGYGRAPGAELNDEGMLLARRFPDLLQVQDKDRVRGGERLVALGADYIVLDDGFQHRRLHRDVDLVCLDAAKPFDHLLPWGWQRERRAGLRRASAVVLTRTDLAGEAAVCDAERAVRAIAGAVPVFRAVHAPVDVLAQPHGEVLPLSALRGRTVVLLSAIARPASFAATVAALGARVLEHRIERDHAPFRSDVLDALARDAAARDASLLVTEKDDVKLGGVPRLVLRIALRLSAPLPDDLLRLR